ncbi:tripartite tricarboxylate transporter substrate binding protein [Roseomonas sp. OT10]|uniref:Bug family tripartite tricarboxylate transporter substrate binding protein n=1 Tax=Roseomonas cutis TaxID=2897332 RepID=UPI001E4D4632|nr:tripartite tricarboxylate transporter substrate binding protein [Roseomonas sp. OT10]UFN47684.1 tripartite tricarboxylate transporter substrate binding protein [Roseomonas sp. OT10]
MTFSRRSFGTSALALMTGAAATRPALAQPGYPARQVTVVIPFAAGGATDIVGRVLAQRLSTTLGQPFVPDNRAGAGGIVGSGLVARARPDGYTLLVSPNSTYAMAALLYRTPYDNDTAFTPISLLASNCQAVCVRADSPLRTLADLAAAARAEPRKISYGSGGIGVVNHLSAELFAQRSGVEMLHAPYRGGGPAAQAVLTGEITLSFVDLVTCIPFLRDGAMRALAVTSLERSPHLPDVPTIAESGLPGYQVNSDLALFAPAGLQTPILARLAEATAEAMRSDEVRERLLPLAIEPVGGTPAEFPAYFAAETSKWRQVIRERNITVE